MVSDSLNITADWEKAAKAARNGTLVEAQIRKVMSEMLEEASGQPPSLARIGRFRKGRLESTPCGNTGSIPGDPSERRGLV